MGIHWESLVVVVGVSWVATLAVVVLVTSGLLGLSARAAGPVSDRRHAAATGPAVGAVCLVAAAAIVLFGLAVMVVR